VDASGLVTYTPALGFTGKDSLIVSVNSPSGSAAITIHVKVINQPPAPTAVPMATTVNTPSATQIDINDPDAGQIHTFYVNIGARHGQESVDEKGHVTYIPVNGFTGSDSFKVIVTDNGTPVESGVVTIKVSIANQMPVPTAPGIVTAGNVEGTAQINVNDPDAGQVHTFSVTTAPGNGAVQVDATGLVTYLPNPGFSGADSLAVTVVDDGTPKQSATVTIPVTVMAVALSVTATPDPVPLNGLVNYQLLVSNIGNATLTNVLLQDTVPEINGRESTVTVTGGGTCPQSTCPAGSVISWPDMMLTAGQTAAVSFTVKVDSADTAVVPDGTVIHNSTTVTDAEGSATSGTDVAVRNTAGLNVGLKADHDPVHPGEPVTYTVSVGNAAGQALPSSNAGTLTASLPGGVSFMSASGSGTRVDNEVHWNIGSVTAGGSQLYTYTVLVDDTLVNGTLLPSHAQAVDDAVILTRAAVTTQVQTASP
jgi:uncharacterized repeat protein (TIGR01451 family)